MQDVAKTLKALADPTRRAVFEAVATNDNVNVAALTRTIGAVSQPAVSQHLKHLRDAGLVIERRQGREAFYRIVPGGLNALGDWLTAYDVFWRDRFTNLRAALTEMEDD